MRKHLLIIYNFLFLLLVIFSQSIRAETIAIPPNGYIEGQGGEIATLAHLRWLSETPSAWDEDWVQTQDIDATDTKDWNGGVGMIPIGDISFGDFSQIAFTGSYDGQHFTISNLYQYYIASDYIGMFGYISSAKLSNIRLVDKFSRGVSRVGGLAASINRSTIKNIYITGEMTGMTPVGGIGGEIYNSTVDNIHADVTAVSNYFAGKAGGIGGYSNRTISSNLFSQGTMGSFGERSNVGGLFGHIYAGEVRNSYTTSKLDTVNIAHGVYGKLERDAIVSNSFFDCELGGKEGDVNDCLSENPNSLGRPTEFFQDTANFPNWDMGSPWQNEDIWYFDTILHPKITPPPVFTLPNEAIDPQTAQEDQRFELQVQASPASHSALPVNYRLENAPAWLLIDSDGLLYGTPTQLDTNLNSTVSIVAAQGHAINKLPPFVLHVETVNDPPHVTDPTVLLTPGDSIAFNLSDWVVDEEGAALQFSVKESPSQISLDEFGVDGKVTLSAAHNLIGSDSFSVSIIDGEHTIEQTVTVVLSSSETEISNIWQLYEDQTKSLDLSVFTQAHSSIVIESQPSHGVLSAQGEQGFLYRPNQDFFGEDRATLHIDNYTLVALFYVLPVKDELTVSQDAFTTDEDQPLTINLATIVNNPDQTPLSFDILDSTFGTAERLSDTTYQFTPQRDFSGRASFSFRATNGQSWLEKTINIDVQPVNDPPIGFRQVISNDSNNILFYRQLAEDIDSENLTFTIKQDGSLGTASAESSYIRYSPFSDETGIDHIVVSVSDGEYSADIPITIYAVTQMKKPADYDGQSGTITSLAELRWVTSHYEAIDKDWTLASDIDASESLNWYYYDHDNNHKTPHIPRGFKPLGSSGSSHVSAFTGRFDGKNHTISNININWHTGRFIGLFAKLDKATVSNLYLENIDYTGYQYVGGLTGLSLDSTIDNVHVAGVLNVHSWSSGLSATLERSDIFNSSFSGSVLGKEYIGGVNAKGKECRIEDVEFKGQVSASLREVSAIAYQIENCEIKEVRAHADVYSQHNAAGIVRSARDNSELRSLHFKGSVTSDSSSACGLISSFGYDSTLSNSSVDASIKGLHAGGLICTVFGTGSVSDSYAHGTISALNSGGLVYSGSNTLSITNSYSSMTPSSDSSHGLIARGNAIVHNSFYDCEQGNLTCDDSAAKTTLELQDVDLFVEAQWDRADAWNQGTWILTDGQYPQLRRQAVPLFTSPSEAYQTINLDEGSAISLNVFATPSSMDDTIQYGLSPNAPSWLSINENTGAVSGTPQEHDIGLYQDIVITASESNSSNQLPSFNIQVNNINYPPIVQEGAINVLEGGQGHSNLSLLVSDNDSEDKHIFSVQQPISGKAVTTITPQGVVTYSTIDDDFVGQDEFVFTVTDGHSLPITATITVQVQNVNDAPQARDHQVTTSQDSHISVDLASLVDDPDTDDNHTFTISPLIGGTGSVQLSGSVATFSSVGEHPGSDRFQYWVTDSHNQTATATVDVIVNNINDAPIISGIPASEAVVNQSYEFIPNITDVDAGDSHRFTISNKPSWASFDPSSGRLSGTPTEEHRGLISSDIWIQVIDQGELSDSLPTFSITVDDAAPIAVADTVTLNAVASEIYQLDVLANDHHSSNLPISLKSAHTNSGQVSIRNNQLFLTLNAPLNTIQLGYTITDELNQTDSAQVNLTIRRTADDSQPNISQPADVTLYAKSLFTHVALTPPQAVSAQGETLPAKLLDGHAPMQPGKHQVRWLVEDDNGSATITQQTVDIYPTVSLGPDITISSSETVYRVPFILNGYSPHYPLFIPYQELSINAQGEYVSAQGEVEITEGNRGYLTLPVASSPSDVATAYKKIVINTNDEDFKLNLGNKASFTLFTQSSALAPRITTQVYQQGQQRRWVDSASLVTFKVVQQHDIAGASYHYDWQADNFDVISAEADELVIDPQSLSHGIYNVTVDVSRNDVVAPITTHQIYFEVGELSPLSNSADSDNDLIADSQESHADDDLDGFPNYLDDSDICQVMPAYADVKQRYLAEVEAGLCLRKGITVANSINNGLLVTPSPDGQHLYIGGVYDFVISELSTPTQLVNVVLPQQLPIPANAIYRKYINDAWQNFVDDINQAVPDHSLPNGAVSSARGEDGYCPPPATPGEANSPWQYGLQQGNWCVQLSIRDGGANDADGLSNGIIHDPSGSATPASSNQAPNAVDDQFVIEQDESSAPLTVLDNDNDANGDDITLTDAIILSGLGTVVIQNQQLLYTPVEGTIGNVTIKYTISDGLLPATAQANVTIVASETQEVQRRGGAISLLSIWLLLPIALGRTAMFHRKKPTS